MPNFVPTVLEKTANGERAYDIYSRLLRDRIVLLFCSSMAFIWHSGTFHAAKMFAVLTLTFLLRIMAWLFWCCTDHVLWCTCAVDSMDARLVFCAILLSIISAFYMAFMAPKYFLVVAYDACL